MSVCEEGSIYWQMLDDARDIIRRYWNASDKDAENLVKEVSEFRHKYCIEEFVRKYPNLGEKQMHNANVLDIWAYHIELAMLNAFDDITLKRWHTAIHSSIGE